MSWRLFSNDDILYNGYNEMSDLLRLVAVLESGFSRNVRLMSKTLYICNES